MKLEQVVPWGRTMWEYVHMFDLDEAALRLRIIGVGDGPASFNAEMHQRGHRVVSVDPIYIFDGEEIRSRVLATHDRLVAAASEHHDLFTWKHLKSPEEMGRVRVAAAERFLKDLPAGRRNGRYMAAALPHLPLADRTFDLALCSHVLFLYWEQLSLEFHTAAVAEMARVASEVRIFPLLGFGNVPSPHVEAVIEQMRGRGFHAGIRGVPYEFQKGGNQMLVIRGA